ncbi:hypothetical protein OROMI_008796 [Orobanche minor]
MKLNDPEDNRVIYHITISSLDGNILWSTRSALGGIKTMNKGEIAMYTIKAELLYDNDVGEISKDDELCVEIELISF